MTTHVTTRNPVRTDLPTSGTSTPTTRWVGHYDGTPPQLEALEESLPD